MFLLAVLNVPNYHIQIPLYKPTSLHEDNQMGIQDALYQRRADHLPKDDE